MGILKTITEAAKETGTTANQLRYWEDNGLIQCKRNAKGVRMFSVDEYSRIELIKKVMAQPQATLDDARRAIFGEQALQAKNEEKQLATTEEMVSAALQKAVESQFKELFEGILSSYNEMLEKQDAMNAGMELLKIQNVDLAAQNEALREEMANMKRAQEEVAAAAQSEMVRVLEERAKTTDQKLTELRLQLQQLEETSQKKGLFKRI